MEKYKIWTECVKCWSVLANSTWKKREVEVIERKCWNCNYKWDEEPLDLIDNKTEDV